jgi:hypothetical protein
MDRKFALAVVAAFATQFVLGFIFHGVLLASDYNSLLGVYRGPQFRVETFSVLVLAMIIMSTAMVTVYRFGRQDRPFLGQGIRFGLMAAALSVIPCYMIGYAVTNVTAALAIKQIVLETISVTAMAVVVAWFHRA